MSTATGILPVANGGTGDDAVPAHYALLGPTSGADAAPTWRAIESGDLPAVSGAPAAVALRCDMGSGGAINEWQVYPIIYATVAYYPAGGSQGSTTGRTPVMYSPDGGTYTILWRYGVNVDVTVTIWILGADGVTWSSGGTKTLSSANTKDSTTVTLAAGECFAMHMAPSGGTATFTSLQIFW